MKLNKDRLRQELQKAYNQLSKRQLLGVATLLLLPGGIPLILLFYYTRYKEQLKKWWDREYEIIIKRLK